MTRLSFSLVLAVLFILAGCTRGTPQSSSTPAKDQYVENVSNVISVEKGSGDHVPDFSWYDASGKVVKLSEYTKGKAVLINFWATWCGPCKAELPDLVALNDTYASKGAAVVGISVDQTANVLNVVHDFAKAEKLAYPIIIDNGELERAFGGIRGIPTSFFVDKNGAITKKLIGSQSRDTFAGELDKLL